MNVRSIDLISGIERAMAGLAQRQKVTAGNIANASTPGFKAQDVTPPDFTALLSATQAREPGGIDRPSVARTPAMARLAGARGGGLVPDRAVAETKSDGNNVTLETQLLRMAEVQAQYAAAANLYRRSVGFIRTALGRGAS